ncbi:unnamed protein product [Hyaloperonospora brassicae]|uniref:RxLR effector candidate protein n=1 Tax=Hyaloperonospora brassicae TaxID=162125 RepID=A0AAV0USR4_HYABA|nr:unnamed protein product [Hyaloperonospora brassicae]
MRPYAILSTALLCLSACGNASAATLDSEQLMTSDVTSPAVAERNLVATDERAEHRRLFSWPWEDDEVKDTDKKTGKAEDLDSAEDKPFHRLFWYRPKYFGWFHLHGFNRKFSEDKIKRNEQLRPWHASMPATEGFIAGIPSVAKLVSFDDHLLN